jgi:glycosyltransferase involved in cell wall biosynthesis
MHKLVTIAVPVYKRMEYLPNVLRVISAQDYPNIELLVSDNGMNKTLVRDIVAQHYKKPFTFRQNPQTVNMSVHFNQLIENASAEFFVVLADDDEITPNYVSDLMARLERNPQASVAMSAQETIDDQGRSLSRSKDNVPELLSGKDFIRAAWQTKQYGFRSFSTFLARRQRLLDCGGFPVFYVACADEDALFVKLSLDSFIAFSTRSTFRKRFTEESDGYSAPIGDLAHGLRDFLAFIDSDKQLLEYGAAHPEEWRESRAILVRMAWQHYHLLWSSIYQKRMTAREWLGAVFEMPFIPAYYRAVARSVSLRMLGTVAHAGQRHLPRAYAMYKTAKARRS